MKKRMAPHEPQAVLLSAEDVDKDVAPLTEAMMSKFSFDVNKLIALCRQNDVQQIGVFGSVARGEDDEQSDIDLLVRFSRRVSLLKMVALERQLSNALGRKVDLLTEAAISPYLRERIKRDLQMIYEAR
jgi:uncharacterized protein